MEIFGIGTHRRSKRTLEEQVGGQRIYIGGAGGSGGGPTVEDVTANFLFVPLPIATTECNTYPIEINHYPVGYSQARTAISIIAQYCHKDGRTGMFCMGDTLMTKNGNHSNPFVDDNNHTTDILVDAPFPRMQSYGSMGIRNNIVGLNPPDTAKRQLGMMFRDSDSNYGVFPTVLNGDTFWGQSGKPTLLMWAYTAEYNSQLGRIIYTNRRYKIVTSGSSLMILTKFWGAHSDSGNYPRMQIMGAWNTGEIGNGLMWLFKDYELFNTEYFDVLNKSQYYLYWAFYTDGPLEPEEWPIMPDTLIRPTDAAMTGAGFTSL